MAQKAYSKHSEYRTYSTKGNYDDGDFDSMKAELLPSKYGSLIQPGNGVPAGNKEYYYEYKEEKDPSGSLNRKDLHTVEQYEFSHSPSNSSRPAITSTPHRPSPLPVARRGELKHNIAELDSLLDDLQKDQDRKPYKSGYASDTMESSSFDYRASTTPVKSSGYSTLSKVDRDVEWLPASPATISREVNREVIRKQVTESHVIPAGGTVPAAVCDKCHPPAVTTGTGVPMNKVTTTVKTYTYEVPAGQDPTSVPIPGSTSASLSSSAHNEHRTYVNTHFAHPPHGTTHHQGSPVTQQTAHYRETTTNVGGAPHVCPHVPNALVYTQTTCPNCALRTTDASQTCASCAHVCPARDGPTKLLHTERYVTNTVDNRSPYPAPASPPYAVPVDSVPRTPNQGPGGPTVYKYSSSNYSYNTSSTGGPPGGAPHPFPVDGPRASPFPRPESPAPRTQEPPKKLDDLLADFPGHENYPSENEMRRRPNPARGPGGAINGLGVEKVFEQNQASRVQDQKALTLSKNIAGPAVYYPPGHENFQRKDEAAAYQQAGGGYRKAKGAYKYEAESSSKSKSSSGAAVVPVCLPLCCAMPCVLL